MAMRKSTKWFLIVAGIVLFIGAVGMIFFAFIVWGLSSSDRNADIVIGSGDKIAVVELKGIIMTSDETVRQIKKYREDSSIRAILFRVDSPGGGVVASQEIFEEVKKTRKQGKPIVVSMGSLAASGGYYVSCGASRIVANPGTLTGSIGVISQFVQWDTLMHKIGLSENTIKTGKFKDAGSPFRPMTPDDKQYFQHLMSNVYEQFVSAVEKERNISHDSVLSFADGRVFSGEQALNMRLVDTLGTYEDAINIAARMAGIRGKPSIVKERKYRLSLIDLLFGEGKVSELVNLKDQILNQPILQYKMP
jgi:protease-4